MLTRRPTLNSILAREHVPRNQWWEVIEYYRRNEVSITQAIQAVTGLARRAGVKSRAERFIFPGGEGPSTVERPERRPRIEDGEGVRNINFVDMADQQAQARVEDPQRANYYCKRGGRRLTKRQRLLNQLSSHVQPIIERWQRNRPPVQSDTVSAGGGDLVLSAGPTATVGLSNWPVYLWDLTCVKNTNQKSATQIYPNVCHRLIMNAPLGANPDFAYQIVPGVNNVDTADRYPWWPEKLPRTNIDPSNVPNAGTSAFIDALKVKLAVYGAQQVPCQVYVEMWRFTDEKIAPPQYAGDSPSAIPTEYYTTYDQDRLNNFWLYMLSKQIGFIDQDKVAYDDGRGVSIKRLWTFKFNADSSNNKDPSGIQKNLTLTHQLNRYVKLDWDDNDTEAMLSAAIGNPDVYNQDSTSNSVCPVPNQTSRVFLCIRADVSQQSGGTNNGHTAQNATALALFPSIDITLRRFRTMVHT